MRALTLWQPWAQAVAAGLKTVETRPPWAMRLLAHVGEPLAIHAGAASSKPPPHHPIWRHAADEYGRVILELRPLEFGAVLAVATIAAVVPIVDDPRARNVVDVRPGRHEAGIAMRLDVPVLDEEGEPIPVRAQDRPERIIDLRCERQWGDYEPGRVAVLLEDVRRLEVPVAARGYQQLWTLPERVLEHVERGLVS